jgi:Putative glycerate kinase
MKPEIKNRSVLLNSGDNQSRRIVLDITAATLQKLNSYERICSILHRQGPILSIGSKKWNLSKKRHVYLIGAGKACNAMAAAVEEILGDWLTDGIAIVKIKEECDVFKKIRVYVGGHPLPNQEGLLASREIIKLIDQSCKDDLFICTMSGGSSALMSYPVTGISLQDEIDTTDTLLKCGAGIREINAIRRHISQMNGGRMAQKIAEKGAELIGFNISDAVSSNPPTEDISIPWPNFSATPMGPDPTTISDALQVIKDYKLESCLPKSVIKYLNHCSPEYETPKAFPQNTYYQLNTLPDSCRYAKKVAEEMGIPAIILSTFIEGEAKDVGFIMAAIAREIQQYHQPIAPPCVVLSAGEAVTTIRDNQTIRGHGGPSQEMVLGFAINASSIPGVCFLSIDSEGTDGTTMAAGGIVDSQTLKAISEAGLDIHSTLSQHSSFETLSAVNCAVITGNTGTNICDFNIMYIP